MKDVTYHGKKFQLSHAYRDYDEYKNAADNILPDEIKAIVNHMKTIGIASEFPSETEFVRAVLRLKFPGYGFGGMDTPPNFCNSAVELPRQKADRFLTAMEHDGGWHVIDDFIGPTVKGGSSIQIQDGFLVYLDHEQKEFRRKLIST